MATYYAINGGGNWSAGGTWSTTAAKDATRTGGATQPTASDTCILDDYSGSVTINTTSCVASVMNCTGYTGTLTFTASQILTISGNVTFSAGMTITGTGTFVIGASTTTCAFTTAGQTLTGAFTTAGTGAKTLTGNLVVNGLFTKSTTHAINGAGTTITCAGGATFTTGSTGTTKYIITGGTWTGGSANVANPIDLQGNVTLSAPRIACVLTYVSGTITTAGSTLNIGGNSTLLTDLGGGTKITFVNITVSATATVTLSSNLTLSGLLTLTGATTMNGAFTVYLGGGLNTTAAVNNSGTATYEFTNTGTWTGGVSGYTANNFVFNSGAATITLSGYCRISGGTTTYTSGTVNTPGGQVFLTNAITLNIGNNINFSFIGTSVGSVITLLADLYSQTVNSGNGYNYTGFSGGTINGYKCYCKRFIHGSSNDYTYGTTEFHIDSGGYFQVGYVGTYSTVTNPVIFVGSATVAGIASMVSGGRIVFGSTVTQTTGSLTFQTGQQSPAFYITRNVTMNVVTTIPEISFSGTGTLTMGANLTATNTTINANGGIISGPYTFTTTLLRQASGISFAIDPSVVNFITSTNLYVNGADNTTTTIKRPSFEITPTTKSGMTTAFNFPDDYTIAFWMKDVTLAEEARILQVAPPVGGQYILKGAGLSRFTVLDGVAAAATLNFDSAVDTTTWHSFIISKSGTTASLYIDGALQADTATVASTGGFAGINQFFGDSSSDGPMPGTIKELVITSDAKNQAWATAYHNAGAGMFVTPVNTTNIFSLWHFSEGGTYSLDSVGGRNMSWAAAPTYTDNSTLAVPPAGKLTYQGTNANQKINAATITDIDASGGNKVYDYQGTVTRCTNIKAITGTDVGGAGVSITNY
jgi:hypothetical protein